MPETVHEYSKIAAQSFIQTSVFIDDRIYMDPIVETDGRNLEAPNERTHAIVGEPIDIENEEVVEDNEVEDPLTGIAIVNSFAAKQIVCSLYRPENDNWQAQTRDIVKVCNAADVVILDWDLFGHIGDRACELIDKIISDSIRKTPERLRLFLVYTYKSDLSGIANEIHRRVPFIHHKCDPLEEETDPDFQAENYRVVVRRKKTRATVDATSPHIIGENELADVAIEEFAKLASGLLQSTILRGLAEIQRNSWKILSKFNQDLDPAFLTHRAMCLSTEDASSHILPLLVSEIEAVLEDVLLPSLLPDPVLNDWCTNIWNPGNHLEQIYGGKSEAEYRRIAVDICTNGFKAASNSHNIIPNPNNSKKVDKAGNFLLPSQDSDINLQFAHFMASRTFYDNMPKKLMLGSILRYSEKQEEQGHYIDQYILCIQPICDCVHLKQLLTVFMFAKLKTSPPFPEDSLRLVIKSDSYFDGVIYSPKSYQCFAATFKPDEQSKAIVSEVDGANICFKDEDGRVYNWVGQLRPSHAQRAVEKFASNLSRVGLTESEWLRLRAPK